ncbi:hypothetical protein ON010_g18343 [Phytophthora cinnamomi]|nr:hypothetical protein ON010_g18343 [Phytophthora cinnamomi]
MNLETDRQASRDEQRIVLQPREAPHTAARQQHHHRQRREHIHLERVLAAHHDAGVAVAVVVVRDARGLDVLAARRQQRALLDQGVRRAGQRVPVALQGQPLQPHHVPADRRLERRGVGPAPAAHRGPERRGHRDLAAGRGQLRRVAPAPGGGRGAHDAVLPHHRDRGAPAAAQQRLSRQPRDLPPRQQARALQSRHRVDGRALEADVRAAHAVIQAAAASRHCRPAALIRRAPLARSAAGHAAEFLRPIVVVGALGGRTPQAVVSGRLNLLS